MTFKEFGDVVYSEDQSVHFMRYTDTAVKRQKVMKALRYSAGKYGDANGFRDACLAKCAGEEKCGGVVFQYHNTDKGTPKKCAFKALEPTTRTDTQKKKDFYRRICYAGGPFTFPHPDPEGAASLQLPLDQSCDVFGKILDFGYNMKRLSQLIECNDGEPYTNANDPACQAAGKTACWDKGWSTGDQSSPWVVGYVQSRYNANKLERRYDNCFRECAVHDQCYFKGANFYDGKYSTYWSDACDGGKTPAVHDLGFDGRYPLENSTLVPLAAACYVY